MSSVPVVAIIKAKPGKQKIVEETLRALLAPTHQEAGCVRYALHHAADDPHTFIFVEKWTSGDALKKHLGSAHIKAAFARQDELIEELRVISLAPLTGGELSKGVL